MYAGRRFCARSLRIISRSASVRCVYREFITQLAYEAVACAPREDQRVRYVNSAYYICITVQVASVDSIRYTSAMTLLTRTAVLQARVRPEIKFASEQVLRSIGLTMTEAMELFLRRLIIEQKLPFEVAALDEATLSTIVGSWEAHGKEKFINLSTGPLKGSRKRQKRE